MLAAETNKPPEIRVSEALGRASAAMGVYEQKWKWDFAGIKPVIDLFANGNAENNGVQFTLELSAEERAARLELIADFLENPSDTNKEKMSDMLNQWIAADNPPRGTFDTVQGKKPGGSMYGAMWVDLQTYYIDKDS